MHHENRTVAGNFHPQDRIVLAAMGAVLAGSIIYGVIHGTWLTALLLGTLLLGAATAAAWLGRGRLLSQTALPFLGMALVGLLIHAARGHNESHFAVFAFLACMVTYRRPLPILVAAGTIAVHHLTFNQLQAWALGPICFTEPSIARVLEHAVYVVAETVVLLLLAAQARASFATAEELTRIVESLQSTDGSIDLGAATLRPKDPTVAQLVGSLQHIARSIEQARTAAESVRVAATEIASGNLSLSTRTEQAGASIQQTASAVEQMAAAIRNGSDNAVQANQLADAASCAAAAGGQAVGGMTTTMNEIQQSSRKITDIIGVIDAIAFQTNILALNAAVEAARAGEQGRGFSVVAAEVRTLARRCAEAAREVKQLITSSVAHVDAGSSLVGTTGKTIAEVVEQVRRVHGLIGQIATGSVEQNDGIGQINQAINRLDRDTQQNAALVEQTSAAADSLRQQADELARAMQVFKVPAALEG